MEKNNVALYSIVFFIVGLIVGWLIWGSNGMMRGGMMGGNRITQQGSGAHMMPGGHMMDNDDMQGMMMDMTARMQGKTGDALDKVFLEDMIVHHQGAVDMAKLLAAGTKRPELQKMAQDIITVQTSEIQMMQGWHKMWFGN